MTHSSSEDEDGGLRRWRRRNARSLDMATSRSREASKAAAWMWHMHGSTSSNQETEEKPASPTQFTKRRSSSCDRRDSRFRQEATATAMTKAMATTTATAATPASSQSKPVTRESPSYKAKQEANIWDCGSNLYDTFELVSFSNRLDRSLLDMPAPLLTHNSLHLQSPLHHRSFARVLRTFSLPRTLSMPESSMPTVPPPPPPPPPPEQSSSADQSSSILNIKKGISASIRNHAVLSGSPPITAGTCAARIRRKSSASWRAIARKWTPFKLAKILKKAKKLHKHMQCFRPCTRRSEVRCVALAGDDDDDCGDVRMKYQEYEENVMERGGGKHCHHHHHHYHHHFVHHVDHQQISPAAREENVAKWPESVGGRDAARSESARLSSDTLFKICADVNWI